VLLRRPKAFSADHELVGDDGLPLAQVRLRSLREAGEIETTDGRRWTVRRDPGFGPWRITDESGATLVTATKDGIRDRFAIEWASGALRLERRTSLGQRRLELLDAASGATVGEVRQRGWAGRTYELTLPNAPDEVLGTVAWLVAMLARRDATAASQN
jgi:hypothetical protein